MNEPQGIVEWVKTYELEHGKKPSEKTLQFVEHIERVCGQLFDQGKQEAMQMEIPRQDAFFLDLVEMVFGHRAKLKIGADVANLWKMEYMEGWESKNTNDA